MSKLADEIRAMKVHDEHYTDYRYNEAIDDVLDLVEKREAERGWQPIETAPKDGKTRIIIAKIANGEIKDIDFDAVLEEECESWEMPQSYWVWKSAFGRVEEPTHFMLMPPLPTENEVPTGTEQARGGENDMSKYNDLKEKRNTASKIYDSKTGNANFFLADNAVHYYERASAAMHEELTAMLDKIMYGKPNSDEVKALLKKAKAL